MSKILSPTRALRPFGGSSQPPHITIFGRDQNGSGWNPDRITEVEETLKRSGVRTLIVPNIPSIRCPRREVSPRRAFKPTHEGTSDMGFRVFNGAVSAGVVVGNKGEAVGVFGTDTVVVIKFGSGKVVVLVCNEHTLFHRDVVTGQEQGKVFTSVVQAAIHETFGWERRGAQAFITMKNPAPPTYPWDDPDTGIYNGLLCKYVVRNYGSDCFAKGGLATGMLDFSVLIERQLAKWGISNIVHDGADFANGGKWLQVADGPKNQNLLVCAL